MPKVSIIIPVYNVEKYLKQCLDSVIGQTLKDIEIICINDNSTDKSFEIIQNYATNDTRFVIINHNRNQGPGKSRNDGLDIASGEYIMFLDPDDWFENNACELAYNQIKQNNNDIVFFGFQRVYEETGETIVDTKKLKCFATQNITQTELAKIQGNYLEAAYTWSQIYEKNFLTKNFVKYSETYLCEDTVFIINAIVNSKTVSVIHKPLYNYRIRKTSISNSLEKHWLDLFTNRKLALEIIQNSENEMAFIYPYLIYLINSINYWNKQITYGFPKLSKKYYLQMQNLFSEIDNKYNVQNISENINYKQFKKIINQPWEKYRILRFIKNIFEITNLDVYKIITIFGIKLKLRRKIRN